MKKIGITPCFFYPDVDRTVFGPKYLTYVEHDMVDYVADNGMMPELLLMLGDQLLEQKIKELDGIIFAGGSDVCPESYGEAYLDKERWPGDKYRDEAEKKIFDLCVKHKKPILAICRGFQLINGFLGGSLYQDIGTELPTAGKHRDAVEYDKVNHEIKFAKSGILASIYKDDKTKTVNSVHHQAVKDLAPVLTVEAHSADNIIEAFSHKKMQDHFILGVQWHPEFSKTLGDKILDDKKLMEYFRENL